MAIKKDEFLNLFDKTGKKVKTGEKGEDTISIDGMKVGDKVAQGDFTVGIQADGEDSSHKVVAVPGFTAKKPTTTTTTSTTSTTTTTKKPEDPKE